MIVNGNIYEGLTAIDKDLKVMPASPNLDRFSRTARPTRSNSAPGVNSTTARRWKRTTWFIVQARAEQGDRLSAGKPPASIESAKAVDPQTVELTAEGAVRATARVACHHRHRAELGRDRQGRAAEAAGRHRAVQIQRMATNGFVLLSRNDAYWEKGLPKLAGLKFNIVPELATRQVGLVNGQYAILPNIDASTALQLKGKPAVKLAETLELAYALVGMNVSKPPFDNAKVREALNYALNRKEIGN